MKIKQGQEEDLKNFIEINSHDPYSKGTIDYMQRWVDLMEKGLENGKTIPEIARQTSDEADIDGITGFMYGCAVNALARFWEHGEELRRWHNGEYDYQGEGVVNPAVITIKD